MAAVAGQAGSNQDMVVASGGRNRGNGAIQNMGGGPLPAGSGSRSNVMNVMANGTVTVDIIAVDADRTLVADISENTDTRKAPIVRAIVFPNGMLQIGQADIGNVTDEEQVVLRMLGRDFVTEQNLNIGRWSVNQAMPKGKENDTYRVLSSTPVGDVNVQVDQNLVLNDTDPFDMVCHGTIVYNFSRRVPKSASFAMRLHREASQRLETTDQNVQIDLVADSMP